MRLEADSSTEGHEVGSKRRRKKKSKSAQGARPQECELGEAIQAGRHPSATTLHPPAEGRAPPPWRVKTRGDAPASSAIPAQSLIREQMKEDEKMEAENEPQLREGSAWADPVGWKIMEVLTDEQQLVRPSLQETASPVKPSATPGTFSSGSIRYP